MRKNPSIKNFQNIFNEVHILLTPKKEHRKVFGGKLPMIGWRKPKSLKTTKLVLKSNVNHLQIIKVFLVVGLYAKFVLLLGKLKLFKTRIKVKHLTLGKGFWNAVPIWLFTWLNVDHVLSSMWVVLFQRPVALLIIIKVGLEKCQTIIPRNVMSIKNNFIVTLILRGTMEWGTRRLLSLIGLKMF